jgi:hypothetical protein
MSGGRSGRDNPPLHGYTGPRYSNEYDYDSDEDNRERYDSTYRGTDPTEDTGSASHVRRRVPPSLPTQEHSNPGDVEDAGWDAPQFRTGCGPPARTQPRLDVHNEPYLRNFGPSDTANRYAGIQWPSQSVGTQGTYHYAGTQGTMSSALDNLPYLQSVTARPISNDLFQQALEPSIPSTQGPIASTQEQIANLTITSRDSQLPGYGEESNLGEKGDEHHSQTRKRPRQSPPDERYDYVQGRHPGTIDSYQREEYFFPCTVSNCHHKFGTRAELDAHMVRGNHEVPEPQRDRGHRNRPLAPIPQEFSTRAELEAHMARENHEVAEAQGDRGHRSRPLAPNPQQTAVHDDWQEQPDVFVCSACDAPYKRVKDLRRHVFAYHDVSHPVQCPIQECNRKVFSITWILSEHMRNAHGTYYCTLCLTCHNLEDQKADPGRHERNECHWVKR